MEILVWIISVFKNIFQPCYTHFLWFAVNVEGMDYVLWTKNQKQSSETTAKGWLCVW